MHRVTRKLDNFFVWTCTNVELVDVVVVVVEVVVAVASLLLLLF